MIRNNIKWLDDPEAELRQHPDGTLIIIGHKNGQQFLGELFDNQPDAACWKYRVLSTFKVSKIGPSTGVSHRFALV